MLLMVRVCWNIVEVARGTEERYSERADGRDCVGYLIRHCYQSYREAPEMSRVGVDGPLCTLVYLSCCTHPVRIFDLYIYFYQWPELL